MESSGLSQLIISISVAAGIGLLIGAERERHKGVGPLREPAGIRTFTITALTGSVASLLGASWLVPALVIAIGILLSLAYWRSRTQDPGLTTEISLLLVLMLGALAISSPAMAAGVGTLLAGLLAGRQRIHRFVRHVLSERELHDLILFLAVALIALPLAPDEFIGPFKAINPSVMVRYVLMVMAISGIGHIATRMLGYRGGISLTGFFSGFISSTATIYAMGRLAKNRPEATNAASAGAVLSTMATMIQLMALVVFLAPTLAADIVIPVIGGSLFPLIFTLAALSSGRNVSESYAPSFDNHVVNFPGAILLSLIVSGVAVLTAALHQWIGNQGVMASAMVAGLMDAHSMVAPLIGMTFQSFISTKLAVACMLLAFSTNSLTKAAVATYAGGRAFAIRTLPVIFGSVAGAWAGYVLSGMSLI